MDNINAGRESDKNDEVVLKFVREIMRMDPHRLLSVEVMSGEWLQLKYKKQIRDLAKDTIFAVVAARTSGSVHESNKMDMLHRIAAIVEDREFRAEMLEDNVLLVVLSQSEDV